MSEPPLLDHMDHDSRNRRLYEHLKALGLFVQAIPASIGSGEIVALVVSSGLPLGLQIYDPERAAPPQSEDTDRRPVGSGENVISFVLRTHNDPKPA